MLLVLLCMGRALAQNRPLAAVYVAATGEPRQDVAVLRGIEADLVALGYVTVDAGRVNAAFAQSGAASGSADALEQARAALGATVVVRVVKSSGGVDWVSVSIAVASHQGQRTTTSVTRIEQAEQKLPAATKPLLPPPPAAQPVPAPVPAPLAPAPPAAAPLPPQPQTAPLAPPSAPPSPAADQVVMQDGRVLLGRIVAQQPGQFVVLDG